MKIKNANVFTIKEGFIQTDVFIKDGLFSKDTDDNNVLDANQSLLIPGLIDIHFHGCAGYDFCDTNDVAFAKIAEYELHNGITSICPASMTLPEEDLIYILERTASFASIPQIKPTARLCGVHLEGPFISYDKKGAQNSDFIKSPDFALFERLLSVAPDLVKLITIAPELEGALPLIEQISSRVHVSLGHTNCDYKTAMEAFSLGADHMTHLYNAMPSFTHRSPGPIGAAADSSNVMVELICDGIHIDPSAVRSTFKLFGDDRIILVSDSMMATGMKDGTYSLGGQVVTVKGNLATLKNGTLAGSVTNLMDCLRVAVSMGISLESAVKCATFNPAKSIGIDAAYGSIAPGKVADCLLLDKHTLVLQKVILGGHVIYTF